MKNMILYGKNSIRERLKINHKSIKKIFIQDNFKDKEIFRLIKDKNISFQYKSEKEILKIKRADRLQGIIAEISCFEYADINCFFKKKDQEKPTIIFLDGINDPHNLGSILRIVACFGNIVLCIPKYNSCEVNETVLHVASGGENYVSVCLVSNIANTLIRAKQSGYWIAGTNVEKGKEVNHDILPFPLCLILGSEGKGMSTVLEKQTDIMLTIPMKGADLSFNVAMACAIFCYEISKK